MKITIKAVFEFEIDPDDYDNDVSPGLLEQEFLDELKNTTYDDDCTHVDATIQNLQP